CTSAGPAVLNQARAAWPVAAVLLICTPAVESGVVANAPLLDHWSQDAGRAPSLLVSKDSWARVAGAATASSSRASRHSTASAAAIRVFRFAMAVLGKLVCLGGPDQQGMFRHPSLRPLTRSTEMPGKRKGPGKHGTPEFPEISRKAEVRWPSRIGRR